jgi:hypothetical protein
MLNQNAGARRNGPASAMIEAVTFAGCVTWLIMVPGLWNPGERRFRSKSACLKCARDTAVKSIKDCGLRTVPGDLIIMPEQCHYSIDKSADLWVWDEGVRKIPTDERSFASKTFAKRYTGPGQRRDCLLHCGCRWYYLDGSHPFGRTCRHRT